MMKYEHATAVITAKPLETNSILMFDVLEIKTTN